MKRSKCAQPISRVSGSLPVRETNHPVSSWLSCKWDEAALGKAAAQAVAKSIEIQLAASDDSATVKLTPDGATKQLTVTLDIHGKWTVSR